MLVPVRQRTGKQVREGRAAPFSKAAGFKAARGTHWARNQDCQPKDKTVNMLFYSQLVTNECRTKQKPCQVM